MYRERSQGTWGAPGCWRDGWAWKGDNPPNKEPTLQLSPGASELSLSQVFKPLAHLTFARGPALSKLSLRSGPSPDDLRASEYEETLLNLTL